MRTKRTPKRPAVCSIAPARWRKMLPAWRKEYVRWDQVRARVVRSLMRYRARRGYGPIKAVELARMAGPLCSRHTCGPGWCGRPVMLAIVRAMVAAGELVRDGVWLSLANPPRKKEGGISRGRTSRQLAGKTTSDRGEKTARSSTRSSKTFTHTGAAAGPKSERA